MGRGPLCKLLQLEGGTDAPGSLPIQCTLHTSQTPRNRLLLEQRTAASCPGWKQQADFVRDLTLVTGHTTCEAVVRYRTRVLAGALERDISNELRHNCTGVEEGSTYSLVS